MNNTDPRAGRGRGNVWTDEGRSNYDNIFRKNKTKSSSNKKSPSTKKHKRDKKLTSSEWLHSELFDGTVIHEPLGWDESNWDVDFYKTKITLEEFEWKLIKSKYTLSDNASAHMNGK